MAWNEKINEKDFESRLVKNLADRPNATSTYGVGGMSAKQLKEWFDNSAHFLKDKINAIIEALGGVEALTNIRITDESGKEVSAKEWIENKLLVASLENPGSKIDISSWVESANKLMSENAAKVGFTDYATCSKAGVVKVNQGSSTNIGITDGLIKVLKATEEHIAARGENYTDYVLAASKTNHIVKAALTDENKLVLSDDEKATARKTLGAASTEDVNGMHLALSDGLNKANTRTDGLKIVLDYDSELYKFKLRLVDKDGVDQSVTNEIDLPLESVVIDVIIPDDGENFVLVLNNGKRIEIPTEVLLRGFVTFADLENYATKEDLESVNIELAPTLADNDPDKAPSVKAVNDGLGGKVDKVTKSWRIYGTGNGGVQTVFPFTEHATSKTPNNTIPSYAYGGILRTMTPILGTDAANKLYVDDTAAAIRAELSPQIKLVEVEYVDVNGGFIVPDDVFPNACLTEAKLVVTDWTTGEETIVAPVSIWFWSGDLYDDERKQLGELETSFDSDGCFYFEMPTGTKCIELNRAVSIEGNTKYGVPSGKCVFQKEV